MSSSSGKYKAFISYAHADERWAQWLQRSLERYRVSRILRQQRPDLPSRLYPVFRDRDELASGNDLSEAIQSAMAASEALIVICSPAAAESHWVNEEIRLFRRLHPDRQILCLMVAGSPQPGASDCAFPQAILEDEQGRALPEPLAADATPGNDGKRDALIKIAAGLLDVGVDDLKQRDAQRRARVWSSVAAGTTVIALLTIGLAIYALMARNEAELRQGQAENLIGFMLGDLREKLEPVGRLDLLDAVGDEAMDYFATLDDRGSEAEVLARALALRQIGEVRFNQGQLTPALEAFTESRDVAAALSAEYPENNQYLFELSQAEFWVGYVAWERGRLDAAEAAFRQYQVHSQELARRSPDNDDYRFELMFAHSNLGSVAREAGQPQRALDQFNATVDIARSFTEKDPDSAANWRELASGQSWRGSTLVDLGRLDEAQAAFETAIDAQARAFSIREAPADRRALAELRVQLSGVLLHLGQVPEALAPLKIAEQEYQHLVNHDPDNGRWQREFARTYLRLAEIALIRGDLNQTDTYLAVAREINKRQIKEDPSYTDHQWDLLTVERAQAESYWRRSEQQQALELAGLSQSKSQALIGRAEGEVKKSYQLEASLAAESLGRYLAGSNARQRAETVWREALSLLPAAADCDLLQSAVRSRLTRHLRLEAESESLRNRLAAAGFSDPRYGFLANP